MGKADATPLPAALVRRRTASLLRLARGMFAFRHHQMVRLMMSTLHHDPHEAECLELGQFLGVTGDDGSSRGVILLASVRHTTVSMSECSRYERRC